MTDHDDWFGIGWGPLERQVLAVCREHASTTLWSCDDSNEISIELAAQLAEKIYEALLQRARKDSRGLWRVAVSLFHPESKAALRNAIIQDRAALMGERESVAPMQAFNRLMKTHLRKTRNELAASGSALTQHHRVTWDRLNGISLELARQQHPTTVDRCSIEHWKSLLAIILRRYPRDHNLPRSLDQMEFYFYSFCDECRRKSVSIEEQVHASGQAGDIEASMSVKDTIALAADTSYDPPIEECLRLLHQHDERQAESVMTKYRLADARFKTETDLRRETGVSRAQFAALLRSAILNLRNCLERDVSAVYAEDRNIVSFPHGRAEDDQ